MPSSEPHQTGHLPAHVKIVILVQAAIILAFSVAMYEEYLSNVYLQQYIVQVFTSNTAAEAALSMITASVFAIGTFTLLGSMKTSTKVKREWQRQSEPLNEDLVASPLPVLERIEAKAKPENSSPRPSRRKRRSSNDDLFSSMTRYAAEHE